MKRGTVKLTLAAVLGGLAVLPPARPAVADCRVAEVSFTPAPDLQIVVWLEDAAGNFVDTLYVTRGVGRLGLGNRPGRPDFNSEVLWPYGRREMVLPVWAHRRGVTYPKVVFQDQDESDLSHAVAHSSSDPYYCRPLATGEQTWQETLDTGTCATSVYTDKGVLSAKETSLYPPRNDLAARRPGDAADMLDFAELNDLDAVSRATPPGGRPFSLAYLLSPDLPSGDYVIWLEASRESDFNEHYNPSVYPSPVGIPWSEYGQPFIGQPSIVWQVPITVDGEQRVALTASYAGYADPLGAGGELNLPDATITTVAGSYVVPAGTTGSPPARTVDSLGAARLLLESSPEGLYQVRVEIRPEIDAVPPAQVPQLVVSRVDADAAIVAFSGAGDDGFEGDAARYEVRWGVGEPPAAADFATAGQLLEGVSAVPVGATTAVRLPGLYPETHYWVGVRATDDCLHAGEPRFRTFTTPRAEALAVDACFVATAAYGSLLDAHVGALRVVRDRFLRTQVLGELFVEAYYTFAPAAAGVIRPSDTLRALSREGLAPFVNFAQALVE